MVEEQFQIGKEYSTSAIRQIKGNSYIPSDYCYNSYCIGSQWDEQRKFLFEKLEKGVYKYLGENYQYTGKVFDKNNNLYGCWQKGVFTKSTGVNMINQINSDELISLIKNFISGIRNETIGLKVNEYKKEYNGTILNAHFYKMYGGNSKFVNTPWITFLGHNQKTTNGIYPSLFYDRKNKIDNFQIGYSISEKNKPNKNWNIDFSNLQANHSRTFFCKLFLTINNENDIDKHKDIIINSLNKIISDFHNQFISNNQIDKGDTAMTNIPLNQVLYGPPGTGKTYNTVLKAMSIIDGVEYKDVTDEEYTELKNRFDELKQKGQIEFVTFHQSYSYEEFVEGIKPNLDSEQLSYKLENGIFKQICKNAKQIKTDKTSNRIDFSKTRIFKMSLGANWENETEDIYSYCLDNNVVALGWGGDKDFSNCNTSSDFKNLDETWGAKAVEIFKNWMRVGDIILISNGNSNIKAIARITGNYEYRNDTEIRYCQFRNVEWLYSGDDIPVNKIYDKKLSQQAIYGFYSNDREGKEYYNSTIKTDVLNDIITGTVNSSEEQPYILIIDEINRGDVSKIFGELITLIEEDKRIGNKYQMKTTLPYSKEQFGVPNNLYIIGTMNTADRSIALLDTALRRRFDFEEIMPRPELLAGKVVAGINLEQLLKRINERITEKYDRDHQIGHSYLMDVALEKNDTDEISKNKLERAYKNRILPLLNEYFYNDEGSVAKILNDKDYLKNDVLTVLGNAQKQNEK